MTADGAVSTASPADNNDGKKYTLEYMLTKSNGDASPASFTVYELSVRVGNTLLRSEHRFSNFVLLAETLAAARSNSFVTTLPSIASNLTSPGLMGSSRSPEFLSRRLAGLREYIVEVFSIFNAGECTLLDDFLRGKKPVTSTPTSSPRALAPWLLQSVMQQFVSVDVDSAPEEQQGPAACAAVQSESTPAQVRNDAQRHEHASTGGAPAPPPAAKHTALPGLQQLPPLVWHFLWEEPAESVHASASASDDGEDSDKNSTLASENRDSQGPADHLNAAGSEYHADYDRSPSAADALNSSESASADTTMPERSAAFIIGTLVMLRRKSATGVGRGGKGGKRPAHGVGGGADTVEGATGIKAGSEHAGGNIGGTDVDSMGGMKSVRGRSGKVVPQGEVEAASSSEVTDAGMGVGAGLWQSGRVVGRRVTRGQVQVLVRVIEAGFGDEEWVPLGSGRLRLSNSAHTPLAEIGGADSEAEDAAVHGANADGVADALLGGHGGAGASGIHLSHSPAPDWDPAALAAHEQIAELRRRLATAQNEIAKRDVRLALLTNELASMEAL
eukprot:6176570-Pleurochrysis_carterae.AAC.1